jgi:6-phosphogluconolactonase (cycloisomerase 2 family)
MFHLNGRFLYVANELDGTVTVCSWNNGKLTPLTSTRANGPTGATAPGEITISADGRSSTSAIAAAPTRSASSPFRRTVPG